MGYHLNVKVVSRAKGAPLIAKAAYNGREKLLEERTGETKDFSRTKDRPLWSGIFVDPKAAFPLQDREAIWNAVDQFEKRKDAQTALNFIAALPHQLTAQQREYIVKDFAREQFMRKGLLADVHIHAPDAHGDHRNYHVHMLVTLRTIGPQGFGEKFLTWENYNDHLHNWREKWAERSARELEKAGFRLEAERWRHGHKTLAEQRTAALARGDQEFAARCDREEATKHLGPQASALERAGIATERGDYNRASEQHNRSVLQALTFELQQVQEELTKAQAREERRAVMKAEHVAAAQEVTLSAAQQAKLEAARTNGLPTLAPTENAPEAMRARNNLASELKTAPLGKTLTALREAWQADDRSPHALAGALEARQLILAAVSAEEARTSERTAAFARTLGRRATAFKEGELVVVNERGGAVYRLNERTTGATKAEIEGRLVTIDREPLPSVTEAKAARREAARAAWQDERDRQRPVGKTAGDIRLAWNLGRSPDALAEGLTARGLRLAVVSAEEARASERVAAFVKEIDRRARVLTEGSLIVVNAYGNVFALDPRTTGATRAEIAGRLVGIDRAALLHIADTQAALQKASRAAWQEKQDRQREATRLESALTAALHSTKTAGEFAAALDKAGIATLARATETDLPALATLREQQREEAENYRRAGTASTERHFAKMDIGDLAAITRNGHVIRLNPYRVDGATIQQRLEQPLLSVVEGRAAAHKLAVEKKAERETKQTEAVRQHQQQNDEREARHEQQVDAKVQRDTVRLAERLLFKTASASLSIAGSLLKSGVTLASGLFTMLSDAFGGAAKPPTREEATRIKASREEQRANDEWVAYQQERAADQDDRLAEAERQRSIRNAEDFSFLGSRYDRPDEPEEQRTQRRSGGRHRERD